MRQPKLLHELPIRLVYEGLEALAEAIDKTDGEAKEQKTQKPGVGMDMDQRWFAGQQEVQPKAGEKKMKQDPETFYEKTAW
ncbi:hypothetical protein [Streptococcus suis]